MAREIAPQRRARPPSPARERERRIAQELRHEPHPGRRDVALLEHCRSFPCDAARTAAMPTVGIAAARGKSAQVLGAFAAVRRILGGELGSLPICRMDVCDPETSRRSMRYASVPAAARQPTETEMVTTSECAHVQDG
jgi:hypothetical protein